MNRKLRKLFTIAIIFVTNFILWLLVLFLLFQIKKHLDWREDFYEFSVEQRRQECALKFANNSLKMRQNVECAKLIDGDFDEICIAGKIHRPADDSALLDQLDSCRIFKNSYYNSPKNHENFEFPIAYAILVHGTNILQLEKLLRSIYNSNNFYCIHVDLKSVGLLDRVERLTNCFENVKISAKLYEVFWGGIEILLATLACMRTLLKINEDWKYFIDLSGQDFPLKTQAEIVEFLKGLDGQNHVEIGEETLKHHYKFRHEIVRDSVGFPSEMRRTSQRKSPPPQNLTIFKGNVAAILHRSFCDWIQNSEVALELLEWLHDVVNPDEHYWATLLGNKQLKSPGGANAPENFLGRYAVWKPSHKCRGKFVHDVCIFGAEDVKRLLGLPHLFVNKFYYEFETPAFDCIERWLANK